MDLTRQESMIRVIRILSPVVALLFLAGIAGGYFIQVHKGCGSLGDWGNYLTGVGTIILAIAAMIAGREAVKEYADRTREYGDRTRAEQIRWLRELFGKLFQDGLYHRMRQKVDYEDLDDVVALLERNKRPDPRFSQDDRDKFDEFADYQNFFEFIAFLMAKKQVEAGDVNQIFDYYLKRFNEIKQSGAIMEYLEKDGFGNLRNVLLQYRAKAEKQQN
jgi:hypothetical protein